MKFLFIGDIVGNKSLNCICKWLPAYIKRFNINFVIANGENISSGNGILPEQAIMLHQSGVDIITGGNHTFDQHQIFSFIDDSPYIVRPYNFSNSLPGEGYLTINTPFGIVGVINLCGQVNMKPANNPFEAIDLILPQLSSCDYIILDFHAEATSEKIAMGYFCDGRLTGVFGTHTHVQTSDYRFLPKGTAYITDVGMVGGFNSVLGVKKDLVLKRFVSGISDKFEHDNNDIYLNSIILDTDLHKLEILNCFL